MAKTQTDVTVYSVHSYHNNDELGGGYQEYDMDSREHTPQQMQLAMLQALNVTLSGIAESLERIAYTLSKMER